MRTNKVRRRPGRPAVPMESRGLRPYDPRWGTPKRWEIIHALHRHRKLLDSGELTHCDLAAKIGTSISYLSIVKNSPWGQCNLRVLEMWEEPRAANSNEETTE